MPPDIDVGKAEAAIPVGQGDAVFQSGVIGGLGQKPHVSAATDRQQDRRVTRFRLMGDGSWPTTGGRRAASGGGASAWIPSVDVGRRGPNWRLREIPSNKPSR